MPTPVTENSPDIWKAIFPMPLREGNKYSRGHALVYGGDVITGASRLSARAAQRMGAGLVTIATSSTTFPIYAASLESVMVSRVDDIDGWNKLLADPKKNVVLAGPGAGVNENTRQLVLAALATYKPCVLDADALTSFEDEPDKLFDALHEACALTPHEGEFARLFGKNVDMNESKIVRTQNAAKLAGCTVLLKGADTVIADHEERIIVNNNAPPWLATAGAGDVLAGMILGLTAQGMPMFEAAAAAAWVHGHIANQFGIGLIAEDLVNGIPAALSLLQGGD